MNIPESAIEAAVNAYRDSRSGAIHPKIRAALEAALPHLEAALRKQIAADIRALKTKADLMSATDLKRNSAIDDAARIVEEGTTK